MQIFTRAMKCISVAFFLLMPFSTSADWTIDFSRRVDEMKKFSPRQDTLPEKQTPGNVAPETVFAKSIAGLEAKEEIVILNTSQGFVPSKVRVMAGRAYKFIVVNVNEENKNVSFIMDSFAEHHGTYYGQLKSFVLAPAESGVYMFSSPETAAKGSLIVQPGMTNSMEYLRTPASVSGE